MYNVPMPKRRRKRVHTQWRVTIFTIILAILSSQLLIHYLENRTLERQSQLVTVDYPYPTNNYDWNALQRNEQFLFYEDENYTSRIGIDVSSHQKDIDWAQVKQAGISFAFIRAGYRGYSTGSLNKDEKFDQNMEGAISNGIDVGIYVFSQAVTIEEAAQEADLAIEAAKNYNLQLPIVFDLEEGVAEVTQRVSSIDRQEKTQMAVTFMNRVREAGYQPMIYGSTGLMESLFDLQYLQDYPFWVAEYDSSIPHYVYEFDYWQYTSTATLPGISTNVDMNIQFIPKN